MKILRGIGVSEGVVLAPIYYFKPQKPEIILKREENFEKEQKRFELAQEQAAAQLKDLQKKLQGYLGEKEMQMFEVYEMMLRDEDFNDAVKEELRCNRVNAEYAVDKVKESFVQIFLQMDDSYMKSRAADIEDVSDRLIQNLKGEAEQEVNLEVASVILAEDLTPSEMMRVHPQKIAALVISKGSNNSHVSILAKAMKIPMVIGIQQPIYQEWNGKLALTDGKQGVFIIEPDDNVRRELLKG